jgi:hypothetical protein
MKEIILNNLDTFVGAVLTGIAGFLFGKKKLNAEVAGLDADNEGKEIENADKLVKLYKEAIDDLGVRYEVKFKEVTAMYDSKVKLLEDEINLHKRIIAQLKEENTMLRTKIKDSGIIL